MVAIAAAGSASSLLPWIGTAVAIAVAATMANVLSPAARERREWKRHCRQLARASGLTAAEAEFLWRLARLVVPVTPILVFVRPTLLDHGQGLGATPEFVRGIRDKLFGG